MRINEFISRYKNHPVLFIGTGISLRYLKNSYLWDDLLKKIAFELKGNDEYYLEIKSKCYKKSKYRYNEIATILEKDFNDEVSTNRNGKFKFINDIFYENMKQNICISRFKLYIAELLKDTTTQENMCDELAELMKVRKNISSIITTNYDCLIESIFDFNPLVGNNILLSNPYGSLYKIHGCVTKPDKIIMTEKDYEEFNKKYELIRAQLLSLFIHNPIIFLGYNLGDENIKNILRTIFTYIEPNTEEARIIRANFLLVEYEKNSQNNEVIEHDIDIEGYSTISINKLKTDNYVEIYRQLSNLQLPVSAMDIRKVQSVVKNIYAGGEIKVKITEDLDGLSNCDKILAIGSSKTIEYKYLKPSKLMEKYFDIIDEWNFQIINLIEQYNISSNQYFPAYAFAKIKQDVDCLNRLKEQQLRKLQELKENIKESCKVSSSTLEEIFNNEEISTSYKHHAIVWAILEDKIELSNIEKYLREYEDKTTTDYRRILCAYDYKKYYS